MDTQPWIILYSFLFYKDFYGTKNNMLIIFSLILFFLLLQIIISFIFWEFDIFYIIRGISGYLIFLIIYFFQKKHLLKNFILYQNVIFKINFIYIIVAIFQLLVSPFATSFLVNVRTSEQRGVTSLTPEPTMFGILLIFFCLIYTLILNSSNKKIIRSLILLNFISILLIAKSATASLYLLLGIILWFLINLRSIKMLLIIMFIIPIFYISFSGFLTSYLDNARVGYIFNSLVNGDLFVLLANDKSIQDRILANIFPFKASYNIFFMPGGFNLELTLKSMDLKIFDTYFSNFHTGSRIMSLWGSLIAELGFVFIILFIFYSFFLFKEYRNYNRSVKNKILFLYLMIILLGFTSFTISFSLLAFLLSSISILKNPKYSIN